MPLAAIDMRGGLVNTTSPLVIFEREHERKVKRIVRLATLYNPNAAAVSGVWRVVLFDEHGDEVPLRVMAFTAPATDSWIFGSLGAFFVVPVDARLELELSSSPTSPIEYSVHFAEAI